MFIAAGSVVTIDNSTIEGSTATGQQAGDGGSSAVLVNASYYIGTGSIGPAAAAGNGSVMFQWTVPGGPTATATSTPTSTPTATPSPTATASPIASPTAQSTITLTTVLSSLGTNYDIVLGFDASTGGAESYFTSSSMQAFNTLTTLQPLRGYWGSPHDRRHLVAHWDSAASGDHADPDTGLEPGRLYRHGVGADRHRVEPPEQSGRHRPRL